MWVKYVWNLVCDFIWLLVLLNLLFWGIYGFGVSWDVFICLYCVILFVCLRGCLVFCFLFKCYDLVKFKR